MEWRTLLSIQGAYLARQYWIIFVCTLISCAVGRYIIWQAASNYKKKGGPPGPPGLPLLGHLHLLGDCPHKSLFNLSKLHGPLMWLRFGSVPVIVASTPLAARLILQTNDQVFAGRPRPVSAVCLTYDCTDITFSPPNSSWKLMRQICVTNLFSSKCFDLFKPIREMEARRLVGSVMKEISQSIPASDACAFESICTKHVAPSAQDVTSASNKNTGVPVQKMNMVSMRTKLLQANNNTISRIMFGKTLSEIISSSSYDDPSLNLLELLDKMLQCLSVFNLGDLIPSIAWMDLQGVRRRSRAVARKLDIVLQEIVDLRRHNEPNDDRNSSSLHKEDLLDVLLSLSAKNAQMVDDNIKAVILDLFIGGTDTFAYTTEWAIAELMANPSKMKAIQEEVDNVVGRDRVVQESDLAHLPYLRAVVSETMRLHPVIPFLIPHVATQQCKLLDFDVLENTQVYVNVWAVSRDENSWKEPLVFKPERFLNSSVSVGVQSFDLLPFGAGRRGCPGWTLGLLIVQLQLASLLQGFDWFAPPNFDMEDKFGIMTIKAKPLDALATPKLSTHLYFDATTI